MWLCKNMAGISPRQWQLASDYARTCWYTGGTDIVSGEQHRVSLDLVNLIRAITTISKGRVYSLL